MTILAVLPNEVQPQANPLVNVFNTMIDGVSQLAVNARDLHKFLKVGRDFSNWIKSRISQYIFVENVDYIVVENLSSPNRANAKSRCQKMTDYHLTLDMAKELSMVENNEEGRKVRRYFIRCEKDLYKSDSQQREILVKACSKLAIGNMLISDVYLMVGKQFGYEGGIKDIPTPLLPEATAFVYEMILRLKQPKETNNLAIMDCGKKLIHSMNYIYSWYRAIEQPFKMLSPNLNAEIHDHMQDGKIFATSLARHLNINEPMPKKYWSISR